MASSSLKLRWCWQLVMAAILVGVAIGWRRNVVGAPMVIVMFLIGWLPAAGVAVWGAAMVRRWRWDALVVIGGGLGFLVWRYAPTATAWGAMVAGVGVAGLGAGLARWRKPARVRWPRWRPETWARLAEAGRVLGLLGVAVWLIHPYMVATQVGAGDALFYIRQVQDAAAQLRAGVFPPMVSQSDFALNGDIHPLRTAPYCVLVAGAVEVVSGGWVSDAGALNFVLVAGYFAAVGLMYLTAVRLRPRRRNFAWWVTLAWAASPGVLSLLYSGDMFASWTALPWLPVVFGRLLIASERAEGERARHLAMAGGALGVVWWAHSPIALWTSGVVAVGLLVFWLTGRSERGRFYEAVGLVAVAIVLAAYVLGSVAALGVPGDPNMRGFFTGSGFMELLRLNADGWFKLAEPTGAVLTRNLHFGFPLLALVLGLAAGWRRMNGVARALAIAGAGLLLLLTPASATVWFWSRLPEVVMNSTDKWPMQRFIPLLCALLPMLAMAARSPGGQGVARRERVVLAGLAVLVGLGIFDARKFVDRGRAVTLPPELWARVVTPESAAPSRYSHEMYQMKPRQFLDGAFDVAWGVRPLDAETLAPLDLGLAAFPREGEVVNFRFVPTEYGAVLEPAPVLEPGGRYRMHFDFGAVEPRGTLQVLGDHVFRTYGLPDAGGTGGFNVRDPAKRALPLWTTAAGGERLLVRYYAVPGVPAADPGAGAWLEREDAGRAPLVVENMIPLRLRSRLPGPAWLEVPKLFVPGYEATVNGKVARVGRSPDDLVMVRVAGGEERLEIRYPGRWWMRALFWVSFGGAVGLLGLLGWRAWWVRPGVATWVRRMALGALLVLGGGGAVAGATWAWREVTEPSYPIVGEAAGTRLFYPKFQPRGETVIELWREPAGRGRVAAHLLGLSLWLEHTGAEGRGRVSVPINVNYLREVEVRLKFTEAGAEDPPEAWLNEARLPWVAN